jgi:Domain of unknown function (DUF4864)
MSRRRRRLFALALVLLTFPACAHQWGPTGADRLAIRRVIERQLEAFRHGDAVAAFVYASPAIQAKYRTPDNFMAVVKTFYRPVYRPRREGGFTNLYMIDGMLTQPVLLVGPDGECALALYAMQKQPDGEWKIAGCSPIPEL